MDRKDVAYMINTTPKYFYLLELHLTLLYRYAPELQWPVFLVTEEAENPVVLKLRSAFPQIHVIGIPMEKEAFFESRAEGVRALPAEIEYVFPIQEDFLLEGRPMENVLKGCVEILDASPSVSSMRLMPCPGPRGSAKFGETSWNILEYEVDEYMFTYQATMWRREAYQRFMDSLVLGVEKRWGSGLSCKQKVEIQIQMNVAEREFGKEILLFSGGLHLAWPRDGKQANAVYLSPWPYRPTAVVHGKLEEWAIDLARREGLGL
jgi:hypothetical protein